MSLYSRIKNWTSGNVLYASDLNNEFNNILNNSIASSIASAGSTVSDMQQQVSPGGLGSESPSGSVADDTQRLRWVIAYLMGRTYWYDTAGVGRNIGPGGLNIQSADFGAGSVNNAALGASSVLPGNLSPRSTYTFTISSATATAGWQYTNNGNTFTLIANVSAGTTAYFVGTGAPSASGTLTHVAASGASSDLTFSAFANGSATAPIGGFAVSAGSGGFTHTGDTTLTSVTNLSVTLTTTGRPVMVGLMDNGDGGGSFVSIYGPSAHYSDFSLYISSASTSPVSFITSTAGSNISVWPNKLFYAPHQFAAVDMIVSGAHTYTCKVMLSDSSDILVVNKCKLFAYEL